MKNLVVLKFGGSVLRDECDLASAVHEVYRFRRRGAQVIAVVSALSGTTDELLARCRALELPDPDVADVVASGEETSARLLCAALDRAGVPAEVLDARAVLRADGPVLDAGPRGFDVSSTSAALERSGVIVLPGFVAGGQDGGARLLGRGGSDLSALFVADRMDARLCRLIKDVDGCYESDPALPGPRPRRFLSLDWDHALSLGGEILQAKALGFARDRRRAFEVGGLAASRPTRIGNEPLLTVPSGLEQPRPLRVALIGFGTVGRGVYASLAARPDLFEVTRILVRDPARHVDVHGIAELLTTDAAELASTHADVVVELAGGVEPAALWIGAALAAGRHVVTANKAVLARHGPELERLARTHGVRLSVSASVGGAVPVLEAARRLAPRGITAIDAVLNGTSNYVLDRMAQGEDLKSAVEAAQTAGFAEADPSLDLDGGDAAHKLECLARAAFDALPIVWQARSGIEDYLRGSDGVARLVARARRAEKRVELSVALERLAPDDLLARTRDEHNTVRFQLAGGGSEIVSGKGAGRAPTTAAVMADLFDLARANAVLREVPA